VLCLSKGGQHRCYSASGEVYKLANVAEFPGRYTQSTGAAGFSTSGGSDLWLQNSAGVIMHLRGTSTGAMLTLAATRPAGAILIR
jgi:hypothetical protein